jgi:hypothetical protein
MSDYRAYRLKDDHVDGPPGIIVADGDQEAIERAKSLANGHDIELWDGPRFVIGIRAGK